MRREVKIGVTVLSAFLLMYLFLAWVKQAHFFAPDTHPYTFRFSNATGLLAGDPVTYMGVRVGVVQSIQFSGNAVDVHVAVDKGVAFASDAVPHLMVREIMGGKIIDVLPGHAPALLPPGALLFGKSDLDFQGAFREAGNIFAAIRPQSIDSLIRNLSSLTADLSRMTAGLEQGTLQKTIANLNQVSGSVTAVVNEIQKQNLIQEMAVLMNDVGHLTQSADSALNAVTSLSTELHGSFLPKTTSTLENVDRSLAKADTLLVRMNQISGMLLNDSTFAGAMISDPSWEVRMDSAINNFNLTLEHLRTKKVHVQLSLSPKQKKFTE